MSFGIPPFVGLDSLVRRRTAQMRDLLPELQDIGIPGGLTPTETDPLGTGGVFASSPEPPDEGAPPSRPGFFGRLGSRAGIAGIARGIASGRAGRNPFESFALGLSGSLEGSRAARDAQAAAEAEKAEKDRQYELEAERNQIGWANANRDRATSETTAEKLQARVDFLRSIGASDDQIMADILQGDRAEREAYTQQPWYMAPGVDPEIRAKYEADALRGPQPQQGSEDVSAIASVYGVSEPYARVMKVSGATRIRPRKSVTTGPNPITGKIETKETIVMEPVKIATLHEAIQGIQQINNPALLEAIANGTETPDEWADDPELQSRLRGIAAEILQEMNAESRAAAERGFGEQSIFNVR